MVGSHDLPYWQGFMVSSLAPATAALFTNPIEVAKVHQQMHGELARGAKNKGAVRTVRDIANTRGIRGLQAGLQAAVLREGTKNLFRIGCYSPFLEKLQGSQATPDVWMRLTAGAGSGLLSAYICNPLDLLKTRLQVGRPDHTGSYPTVRSGVQQLWLEGQEGKRIAALWRGCHVSALRSALATSANLPSYSLMKEALLRRGYGDSLGVHMLSGLTAGLATCVANNPVDVLRSRLYNQPLDAHGQGRLYSSAGDAVRKIVAVEGAGAFYKGFWSHYCRAGPHFVLTFVFLEQLRKALASHNSAA